MLTRDPTAWMWARACELLQEADRLQYHFFRLRPSISHRPAWEPPADIIETTDGMQIFVALPGVPLHRLEVAIDGYQLIVNGDRPAPISADTVAIHRLEIPFGRFERRIPLPPGDYEVCNSQLVDGCLQLKLHKLG